MQTLTLTEWTVNNMEPVQPLAMVLQECADAVIMFDAADRLLFFNPVGQTLFVDQEVNLGQPLPRTAGYDSLIKFLEEARRTGVSSSREICWPDNRVFSASSAPIQDGGCCITLHDVTHFKQRLKIKDEYIVAIAHDLRSPITAIGGYSHLIRQAGPTNEAQDNFIQCIQDAAASMNELIENMMSLATLDLSAQREFKELRLSRLLWQLANEFQPQAEAKQQSLLIEKSQPNCVVRGDETQLRQALRNLLGNAIKYTPEGGAIRLSLYHDSDLVYFVVRDTGYGIPAVDLPHVFDRFYRVRNNGHDDIKGNGLGLAIVKSIAEQHGGNVSVESEVGKGSCFTLTIPLVRAQTSLQN
jgi:signal transduction histidine kinase